MSAEFIAGSYTFTYNAKTIGQTRDGFRLSWSFFKKLITGDLGGQTPQDAVYQGKEQTSSFTLIEADKAGILDLVEPYASTVGTLWTLGVIGLLDVYGAGGGTPVSRCKPLVATAVAGTSAATDMWPTVTIPRSIIREGFPVDLLLGPDLREVPIQMRHYPDMATGLFGSNT